MSVSADSEEVAVSSKGSDWIVVAGVVFVSCLVYGFSSNPGVGFHDSAELALRASQPGATHSPGAPVHTLLGYLLIQLVGNPAAATNWLSMLGGSLAAGVLCLILLELGANRTIAIGGSLAFAFSFHVWGNSVVTETYSLSVLLLACSVLFGLRWRNHGDDSQLITLCVLYGLSLGAHFANILLLPAFIFLMVAAGPNRVRHATLFAVVVSLAMLMIIVANFLLAANVSPFGQATPNSLAGILFYMSGAEHDPLEVSGIGFYFSRIYDHISIFSRHYFYVLIPVGVAGAFLMARREWVYAGFLALIFCLYMGYFTLFGAGDYFTMVMPAYLVFSLWVAVALAWLVERCSPGWKKMAVSAILPAAILLSLSFQFPGRFADAGSARVATFAEQAFALLPDDSVVIAGWREFTVLMYYQQIHARRPDLTIILPARSPRHYPHGDIADYRPYVDVAICRRPVVTNRLPPDLLTDYDVVALQGQGSWHRVELRPATGNCPP